MDKYDYLILDIIDTYKRTHEALIRLSFLERSFWQKVESDCNLNIGQARVGERITQLYLDNLIQNKEGYSLTKKGREALSFQTAEF